MHRVGCQELKFSDNKNKGEMLDPTQWDLILFPPPHQANTLLHAGELQAEGTGTHLG